MDPATNEQARQLLTITYRKSKTYKSSPLWSAGAIDKKLFWGPDGADVLAVEWRDIRTNQHEIDTTDHHVILDLRTGLATAREHESSETRRMDSLRRRRD